MQIRWTRAARKCLASIQSSHFTKEETEAYKKALVQSIEYKIVAILRSMPSKEPKWKGTYRILADRYKVYYSFSEDHKTCYIEGLKHQRQG